MTGGNLVLCVLQRTQSPQKYSVHHPLQEVEKPTRRCCSWVTVLPSMTLCSFLWIFAPMAKNHTRSWRASEPAERILAPYVSCLKWTIVVDSGSCQVNLVREDVAASWEASSLSECIKTGRGTRPPLADLEKTATPSKRSRFRFSGEDLRPHYLGHGAGGFICSATTVRIWFTRSVSPSFIIKDYHSQRFSRGDTKSAILVGGARKDIDLLG